ncbi:MAG: 2-oxoglutarate dehydrogenase complex dihydrolipoyllysine-residue succinyltransferase [Gammaproteobacteria bacterium]|nr:2-oxoglutarate dehydrogenase complex dihydrolipoyllysine-residue succinyltransferase [Gammaproteobacteria bacterium]
MEIEIKAPALPESVPDGTIATWYKEVGDTVSRDELLVDIETDKVVIEVVSPGDGILRAIVKASGETIISNEVIGRLAEGGASKIEFEQVVENDEASKLADNHADSEPLLSPAAKRLLDENKINASSINGSGKGGRITKEDVVNYLSLDRPNDVRDIHETPAKPPGALDDRIEERVPMSRLRSTVAKRMLQASQTTAMLTTFNEVNMKPIMDIRERYKEEFQQVHDGVRLGFMSFFVRASVEALKRFPTVNASLDGSDMIYHGYQDISVAIGSPRGLVAPVLRNADHMGLAQIEKEIRQFGEKANDGKLSIDDLSGGTFTISNGGVFGSLLSTPIVNPPQTAVLGMHKIQERAMVIDGELKALPMMYLALSYDHQMLDGKEAVQFLVSIKELLEDPTRLLLEI